MKQVSIKQIEQLARQFAEAHKDWHYHLLTPTCTFNERKEHAFVLENNTDCEYYVCYTDTPAMDLGKRLLSLLHGEDILAKQDGNESVSESTRRMLVKAEQLNKEGKFWHHHVFFPHCKYNRHAGKWNITFEDQQAGEVLESVSETDLHIDQKEIERLYYLQKTIV